MSEQKKSFGETMKEIGRWIYKLRSVILAIPVAVAAIVLAVRNQTQLPEQVGINLLSSGEFEMMINRNVAVLVPLVVTVFCLLMMFCSRKVLYPWLISIFSLVLPFILLLTNMAV